MNDTRGICGNAMLGNRRKSSKETWIQSTSHKGYYSFTDVLIEYYQKFFHTYSEILVNGTNTAFGDFSKNCYEYNPNHN